MTVKGAGEQEDTSAAILNLEATDEGYRIGVERIKGAGKGDWASFRTRPVVLLDLKTGEPLIDRNKQPRTALVPEIVGGAHQGGSVDEETARHNAITAAVRAIYESDKAREWTPAAIKAEIFEQYPSGLLVDRKDGRDPERWTPPKRINVDLPAVYFQTPVMFSDGLRLWFENKAEDDKQARYILKADRITSKSEAEN